MLARAGLSAKDMRLFIPQGSFGNSDRGSSKRRGLSLGYTGRESGMTIPVPLFRWGYTERRA